MIALDKRDNLSCCSNDGLFHVQVFLLHTNSIPSSTKTGHKTDNQPYIILQQGLSQLKSLPK